MEEKELRESYKAGLKIGKFYQSKGKHEKIRTTIMQMTGSEGVSKEFKMEKLTEICINAQMPVPSGVLDGIMNKTEDGVIDYYNFLAGLNNGIIRGEKEA